jgi:hypothetical protein
MIKHYIHISKELADLFNEKSIEKKLHYSTFYENQELEIRLFMEYLHTFDLLIQKHFYYRSS